MEANIISKATDFTILVHQGQKYGNRPYFEHCIKTAEIAIELGYDDVIVAACLLHDTLEDTPTEYSGLKTEFGEEIAEIVYAVTDELGRNRTERKHKTYPKIKANWKATVVKICDRIANVHQSIKDNPKLLAMYEAEHDDFCRCLMSYDHPHEETNKAWTRLNKLLKPEELVK